ncbi:hypothetical protein [Deinococcus sp. UYEF24]
MVKGDEPSAQHRSAQNRKRLRLGVPLTLFGLIGDVFIGLQWIEEGGLPTGLGTLASLVVTGFGINLLSRGQFGAG